MPIRIELLLIQMHRILMASSNGSGEYLFNCHHSKLSNRYQLKPYEDMLAALVCCWVGASFLEGTGEVFGDETAGIWGP